ncbi:MAG: helix-turn-helix transcriptional regulator [Carnobacterium sp.]|nr:helix-turn-helix transcriptional regulator [Carnobacterium sp.]
MFSEKLRLLRKETSLSQEDVAEKLDVSRQTISKYEMGEATPDIRKLTEISNLFNVSFDYLLGDQTLDKTKIDRLIKTSTNRLTIRSSITNTMANHYKFKVSKVFKPKKNQPYGLLIGVYDQTFWGESIDQLGYYATKEDIDKELEAIFSALSKGEVTYELQFPKEVDKKMCFIS